MENEIVLTTEELKKLQYDEKGRVFNDAKKLYHYTSFEAGCKILASKELIFGKLQGLNDINESFRSFYYGLSNYERKNEFKKKWKKFYQISLTFDRPKKLGFLIPALWGHYAKNGYGVCIVLDKNRIISKCKDEQFYHRAIKYKNDCTPEIYIKDTDHPKTIFKERYKDIFFSKTKDWSYEQEYRIITNTNEGDPPKLNIEGAIIAVIVCYTKFPQDQNEGSLNSAEYKALKAIAAKSFSVVELGRLCNTYNLRGDFSWQEEP